MVGEWAYFRKGDCPVCNGARKDCRQNLTSNIVFCRHEDAKPMDYKFLKFDSLGFGMWIESSIIEQQNSEQREQWIRERKEERERRRQLELEKFAKSLSIEERDSVIREIIQQLSLSSKDHQSLLNRGFTSEYIEIRGYRTVKQWQKLSSPVPDDFPGVKLGGESLLTMDDAILCPIPNDFGQYIGFQIRLNNETEGGKYRWPAGERKRKHRPTSHLQSGELPMSCFLGSTPKIKIPSNYQNPVLITEGVAFKPDLASIFTGITSIGAAGGNHSGSPQLLKEYLVRLKIDLIIIVPDAGAIKNNNVIHQYFSTYNLLIAWGYSEENIKFSWWGQLDKEDGDIDEISEEKIKSIKLISISEFKQIIWKERREKEFRLEQKKLKNFTYKANIEINTKFLNYDELASKLPQEGLINIKSAKKTGKSTFLKQCIQMWLKLGLYILSIVPRNTLGLEQAHKWEINHNYDLFLSNYNGFSELQTISMCWDSIGKLEYFEDWDKTVIIADEAEAGLKHLLMSSTCREQRPKILKVIEDKFPLSKLIVVSDADISDVCANYFVTVKKPTKIFTIINHYKSVIHEGIPEEIDFYIGTNKSKGSKDTIYNLIYNDCDDDNWIEEGIIEDGKFYRRKSYQKFDNSSKNIKHICRQKRIIILTDSQLEAESLEHKINKTYSHLRSIRIDGKTTDQKQIRDFIKTINESIEREKPDILVCTTTIMVGVSIDLDYFDHKYLLAFGVVSVNESSQLLIRPREPMPTTIWCSKTGIQTDDIDSCFANVVKQQIVEHYNKSLKELIVEPEELSVRDLFQLEELRNSKKDNFNPKKAEEYLDKICKHYFEKDPHLLLYSQIKARTNGDKRQYAYNFKEKLEEEGYLLNFETPKIADGKSEEISTIKEQIQKEDANKIAQASDITIKEAEALNCQPTLTEEQRAQVIKAFLKQELPGIEENVESFADFVYKAVIKNKRKWLNGIKLGWFLNNISIAREIDIRKTNHQIEQFANGKIFAPDFKALIPKINLIYQLELFEIIDLNSPEQIYSKKNFDKFKQKAYKKREEIKRVFGITVTKKTYEISLAKRLLQQFGYDLVRLGQKREGKKTRIRYYQLNLDLLHNKDRLQVIEALNRKYNPIIPSLNDINEPELNFDPLVKTKLNIEPLIEFYQDSINNENTPSAEEPKVGESLDKINSDNSTNDFSDYQDDSSQVDNLINDQNNSHKVNHENNSTNNGVAHYSLNNNNITTKCDADFNTINKKNEREDVTEAYSYNVLISKIKEQRLKLGLTGFEINQLIKEQFNKTWIELTEREFYELLKFLMSMLEKQSQSYIEPLSDMSQQSLNNNNITTECDADCNTINKKEIGMFSDGSCSLGLLVSMIKKEKKRLNLNKKDLNELINKHLGKSWEQLTYLQFHYFWYFLLSIPDMQTFLNNEPIPLYLSDNTFGFDSIDKKGVENDRDIYGSYLPSVLISKIKQEQERLGLTKLDINDLIHKRFGNTWIGLTYLQAHEFLSFLISIPKNS